MSREVMDVSWLEVRLNALKKCIDELASISTEKSSAGKNLSPMISKFKNEQINMENKIRLYEEHIRSVYEIIKETKEMFEKVDDAKKTTEIEMIKKDMYDNRFNNNAITGRKLAWNMQAVEEYEAGTSQLNENVSEETYIGWKLQQEYVDDEKTKLQKLEEEYPELNPNYKYNKALEETGKEKQLLNNPNIKNSEDTVSNLPKYTGKK